MKPPLPGRRTKKFYTERNGRTDELFLCDIVQSFEARELKPTRKFAGADDYACALSAVSGAPWGYHPFAAPSITAYFGWDSGHTENPQQEACDAAWRVMHDTDTERKP